MSTIHLVSHTHWDREWYLTFQQFRLKLVQLMDHLLEIFENNPEYKYFLLDGQTIILEDYLEIRPERESEIVQYINQGRLFIGPWYISPDEFLITSEAHIRNLLEGDRLCQKYGGKMSIGYLPDTFGHIGQMPQILRGFGITEACAWRGLDDQPCELNWEAPDGSSVLLSFLRESYSNAANLTTSDPDKFTKEIQELSLPLSASSLSGQILLMNGTDHMEPSNDLTNAIHDYQIKPHQETLLHSNLPDYFKAVRSEINSSGIILPVIHGELRSPKRTALLPNILSTRNILKQRNRNCESELLKWVEPLTAWTNLLETFQTRPAEVHNNIPQQCSENQKSIIHYAWKLLMKCHPHDSICGTSIDQVANELIIRFDQVDQINHMIIDHVLQKLSDQIDTKFTYNTNFADNQSDIISSIIIFNPNDMDQTGLMHLNIKVDKQYSSFSIIDETGISVPYEHKGMGIQELISMTLDKKALKQSLGMIHEGNVAGMVIRDFDIKPIENQVEIQVTLSDHGLVEIKQWKKGVADLEEIFNNPMVNEFIIHAYSDPETDLSFLASDVPGHGYRCYWIQGKREDHAINTEPRKLTPLIRNILPVINVLSKIPFISRMSAVKKVEPTKKLNKIENEFFNIDVQRSHGTITITDKQTKQKYSRLNLFIDSGDCGDLYNYCPPEHDCVVTAKIRNIEIKESIVAQKLIISYTMDIPAKISKDRKSRSRERVTTVIVSSISLVPGVARIDIHTEIYNQSSDHRLRVHFPVPFHCDDSLHDGHYETVQRQIGLPVYDETWAEPPRPEVPQGDFTIVKSGNLSLTITNRGLPEIEVSNSENGNGDIALTLLRCVGWLSRDDITTRKGHAGPMGIATPEAQMIGNHSFDYSIIPGGKNLAPSIHQAYAFNAPLKSMNTTIHSGNLPPKYSFIQNENQDFIITTIKLSEENANLIIRGYNRLSSPIDIKLKLWKPFSQAYIVSLNEKVIQEIPISRNDQVSLRIEGNKIVSLRFDD
jgi:mannosylglycerate hydrolase